MQRYHLTAVDVLSVLIGGLTLHLIRRYFLFKSGTQRTNMPFIEAFDPIFGSKDIIFCRDKVMSLKAHDWFEKFNAKTFGAWWGHAMQIYTKDPDLIEKICQEEFRLHRNRYDMDSLSIHMRNSLLEAKDEIWKRQRSAISQVLNAATLKADNVHNDIDFTIHKFLSALESRIGRWKESGEEPVADIYQLNKNFFMASILRIIYGSPDMVDLSLETNDITEELYRFICVNFEFIGRLAVLLPPLQKLVRPFVNLFEHGMVTRKLTNRLEAIIKKTLATSSDLREKLRAQHRVTTIYSMVDAYREGRISHDHLIGNAFFLLVASFATSVDTMSALMWELATRQDIQDKLRDDLLMYGEESPYLQQVINETLRLYPGSISNRTLTETIKHGKYIIPRGACVNFCYYSVQRDKQLWGDDADEFKPDRMEKSKMDKFHASQFIPFGRGPRMCPGYSFAKIEITKLAAQLFLRYKLESCSKTEPLKIMPLGALPYALPIPGPIYLKISRLNATGA